MVKRFEKKIDLEKKLIKSLGKKLLKDKILF